MSEPGIAGAIQAFFPGFRIDSSTFTAAAGLALVLALVAGAAPAWRAAKLKTVDALGGDE
ncbi:MAG: hypothetical protein AAFQ53_15310 [Bacteroidota bacterium]